MHIDLAPDLRQVGRWPVVFFDMFSVDVFAMTHHVECVAILEPAEKGR
jgi:hypothetical protein